MKINEIHITKFGTIKDLDITASDTLNFFYGIDEINKKTIIDFINSILYGTINKNHEDIRSEYIPEDGSDMSGSIKFTHNEKEYVLERIFNAGKSTRDKITLKNITDDKSERIPARTNPGEYIFNISRDIYQRNTNLNESESVSLLKTSHSKIMQSLLSNILTTASEDISVSDVAKSLNSYNDNKNKNSIAYLLYDAEKNISSLNNDLKLAQDTEKDKINLQDNCSELQIEFNKYNKQYEKLKTEIDYQDMLKEIEELTNSENSHQNFVELSKQFEQKTSLLKEARILNNKDIFSECRLILDKINNHKKELKSLNEQKQKTEVDLCKYAPKDNTDIHDNIIETAHMIEESEYTLNSHISSKNELETLKQEIKDELMKADFEFQNFNSEYDHFEEISQHKILLAEEKLHNSSFKVDIKPIQKSNNLIYASIILICLALTLIIFINNPFIFVILILAMLSLVYSIFMKVSKEKKLNVSRVDENVLREAEREVRDIRNQYSLESDKRKSKIAVATRKVAALKAKEKDIVSQIEKMDAKIQQVKDNIAFYQKQKSLDEAKITPPDPKYYTLRTQLDSISLKASETDQIIQKLSDEMLVKATQIKTFASYSDAAGFVIHYSEIYNDMEKLSQKLSMFSNNEKTNAAKAENKKRISELKKSIAQSKATRKDKVLTEKEIFELKETAAKLLEQSLEIKNKYISAITNMKIQYNDCLNSACIEDNIKMCEAEVSKLKEKQQYVKTAISSYNDALEEIKKEYIPAIAKKSSEILYMLSAGKYTAVSIKAGKIVVKDDKKNSINFETISKQSCDQFYLSLRLAVAEITSKDIVFPIILNDVFLNFNDTKSSALLKFLMEYSKKKQILIFSHHNQISAIAAKNEIPLKSINMVSLKEASSV